MLASLQVLEFHHTEGKWEEARDHKVEQKLYGCVCPLGGGGGVKDPVADLGPQPFTTSHLATI